MLVTTKNLVTNTDNAAPSVSLDTLLEKSDAPLPQVLIRSWPAKNLDLSTKLEKTTWYIGFTLQINKTKKIKIAIPPLWYTLNNGNTNSNKCISPIFTLFFNDGAPSEGLAKKNGN